MVTGFLNQSLAEGSNPRYALYVPEAYDPAEAWPLIVFLHGAGERGRDGLLQTEVGLGGAIRRNPERFPALVLFPQCPPDRTWEVMFDDMSRMIDATSSAYTVDPACIYLTGLSMGGYGAFLWAALRKDYFAALLPICGGAEPADLARLSTEPPAPCAFGDFPSRIRALVNTPIWVFHGADDTVVPPMRSQQAVRALEREGAQVQYTEYEGVGHNSWDLSYQNPEVIAWLLAQRRAP